MADGEYKFPDELDAEVKGVAADNKAAAEDALQIELVDDTPEQDRNRKPIGKKVEDIVGDDEAKQYSEAVQKRFKELSHVAHDERRAKEAAQREAAEAARFAKQVYDDNLRLRSYVSQGEQVHKHVLTTAASSKLDMAKKALAAAYQSGDAEKVSEASEMLSNASIEAAMAQQFRPSAPPTGQEQNFQVPLQQQQPAQPRVDEKAARWQAKNQWFGADDEMTSLALGLHRKLVDAGVDPNSDEYYQKVDTRMREKFPEVFGTQAPTTQMRTTSVVAPVGRSTAPRKVTLSTSQQNLARKLGISNEQYAKSLVALENRNG
jgi:hypothetical protein